MLLRVASEDGGLKIRKLGARTFNKQRVVNLLGE